MESGVVSWGLKSFYARTPLWAKHIILIIFAAFASVLIFDQANPGLIPVSAEHYIVIATPILMLCFKAFGIKYPTDTNSSATEI